MAAQLITLHYRPVINLQGGFESGAFLDVFESGTTTRVSVFSDVGLTVELPNPVRANGVGAFPPVYFDDAVLVRIRVRASDGSLIDGGDVDPYFTDFSSVEAAQDAAALSATQANVSALAASASATAASTSASEAAVSAASAFSAPGTSATSTTNVSLATGLRTFFTQTDKLFIEGQYVLALTSDPAFFMFGRVNDYRTIDGRLILDIERVSGSGSRTDWTLAITGPPGIDGMGTGTVTGVTGTGTVNGISLSGSVTTSGNITLGGALTGVNLASQVTGTLPIANGGTGGTTAASARTALGAAASGANTDITALDQDVTITATGTIAANSIGFRGLPQDTKTANYTLVLADAGKQISITTGGIAIPANGTTAFPIGTTIVIYNNSDSTQSVTIASDTLRLAGRLLTGTRTIAARGLCTLLKVAATEWVAAGNVS